MTAWLSAFVFTQLVEVPLYLRALKDRPLAQRFMFAFLASLLTHPIVWFVFPKLISSYTMMVIAAESFAIIAEGLLLARLKVERAFLWALTVNALSASLGLFSRAAFGWP